MSFKLHEELAEALEIQSYRKLPVLSASRSRSRGSGEICPWLDGDVDVRVMDPNGAQDGKGVTNWDENESNVLLREGGLVSSNSCSHVVLEASL